MLLLWTIFSNYQQVYTCTPELNDITCIMESYSEIKCQHLDNHSVGPTFLPCFD